MVWETGDHGSFNSWDRQLYLTKVASSNGYSSLTPADDQMTNNFSVTIITQHFQWSWQWLLLLHSTQLKFKKLLAPLHNLFFNGSQLCYTNIISKYLVLLKGQQILFTTLYTHCMYVELIVSSKKAPNLSGKMDHNLNWKSWWWQRCMLLIHAHILIVREVSSSITTCTIMIWEDAYTVLLW